MVKKTVERAFAGTNIFFRQMNLQNPGQLFEWHEHNFDHVTWCPQGRVEVSCVLPNGKKITTIMGPEDEPLILIKKGVKHQGVCLEGPVKFFCMYAHRNATGDFVEEYTGWGKAYC